MFDLDRWQEIYKTLKSNKLRTFLTAFGIFWGIFMLVIMLGSGKGLENGIMDGMGDFATNSVFVWTNRTTIPYKGYPRGRSFNFNNEDTKILKQRVPEIETLAPRVQFGTWSGDGLNNVVRGKKTGGFNIHGDYPEMNRIDALSIQQGRFINEYDILNLRKVIVIGQRVYELLFEKNENPIGQYVRIQGVYFQVIGLFKSKHKGGWAQDQEQSIIMPFTTCQKTYNLGDIVFYYAITSRSNVSVSVVETKVKEILKTRHTIAPDDDQAIASNNVEKDFLKLHGLFMGISILVWIVGTGTLLAGMIGVSNIMLVIIKERTKEIGIQRAIGATPAKIITQIISESVVLTTVAGYFGLCIGVGLLELINYLLLKAKADTGMFTNPSVDFKTAMIALVILGISGVLAGIIPAKKAVSVKPIDAIRSE
jgi:putative ABC transport system permease protein